MSWWRRGQLPPGALLCQALCPEHTALVTLDGTWTPPGRPPARWWRKPGLRKGKCLALFLEVSAPASAAGWALAGRHRGLWCQPRPRPRWLGDRGPVWPLSAYPSGTVTTTRASVWRTSEDWVHLVGCPRVAGEPWTGAQRPVFLLPSCHSFSCFVTLGKSLLCACVMGENTSD